MNLIFIMLDSLRQDHVGVYNKGTSVFEGIPACKTPNLDEFAKEAFVFENVYPCGLPTIPVRCELMTGQYSLPYRPWEPLTHLDKTVAEILNNRGYISGLISDTYHYRASGMNFHRNFNCYRWIRGQEYDPYFSSKSKRDINEYVNNNYNEMWKARIGQFLSNTDNFKEEKDWFAGQVINESVEWLKLNKNHKNKFLWIDSFEPHEPWDPPAKFDAYTKKNYKGKRLIMPLGENVEKWATAEEIDHIRGLYAGEASSVDYWLGYLFDTLKKEGYYDNSLIVITADHGHPLADHGKFLKGDSRLYGELLHVPFLMRLPSGKNGGKKIDAIIQFPDVLPTILDILGMPNETIAMQGKSFYNVIKGDTKEHREAAITGMYSSSNRCIRNKEWSFIERPEGEPDELYNIIKDPRETINVIDKNKELVEKMSSMFGSYFRQKPHTPKGTQESHEMASGGVE
jgi:arylsulfatase A-like enzyme